MDQSNYRKSKENYQPILNTLERKLIDLKKKEKNISGILKTAIQNMMRPDISYLEGTIQKILTDFRFHSDSVKYTN